MWTTEWDLLDESEGNKALAKRAATILKVYGVVGSPTLVREIKRMAEMLNIPAEEIFKYE